MPYSSIDSIYVGLTVVCIQVKLTLETILLLGLLFETLAATLGDLRYLFEQLFIYSTYHPSKATNRPNRKIIILDVWSEHIVSLSSGLQLVQARLLLRCHLQHSGRCFQALWSVVQPMLTELCSYWPLTGLWRHSRHYYIQLMTAARRQLLTSSSLSWALSHVKDLLQLAYRPRPLFSKWKQTGYCLGPTEQCSDFNELIISLNGLVT